MHSEVKDREWKDDADSEAHTPDGLKMIFSRGTENDQEDTHCERASGLRLSRQQ